MENLNVQQKVFLQMKNAKNRKLKMKDLQIFVFIAQGKKVHIDTNTQGYYCTNFQTWLLKYKYITKDENRCYKLTSLGKLYITNPAKAISIYQKRYYKAAFEKLLKHRRAKNYSYYVNRVPKSKYDNLQRDYNELVQRLNNVQLALIR